MHKTILSFCAVALLVFGAPAVASADDSTNDGGGSGDAGLYTPVKPHDPTLAGSTIAARCVADVPWIDYSVMLNDPDGLATSHTARLVISDGSNSVTITLGTVTDGVLSGSVLWPGASVDGAGTANGWPGWEFTGGTWHTTDGNFAWTRGAITATVEVNPEIPLPLSYPPAASGCAGGRALAVGASAGLPATGGDIATPIGIGLGAAALLAIGSVLLVRRRKA